MAGGRHIDQHAARLRLQQIKDTKDRKDFVHAGRHHVHERREHLFFEAEVNVQPARLHAGGGVELLFDATRPAAEFKYRIHLHGAETGIAKNAHHLVPDLTLEDVIQ